jgi:hypothetical protein
VVNLAMNAVFMVSCGLLGLMMRSVRLEAIRLWREPLRSI